MFFEEPMEQYKRTLISVAVGLAISLALAGCGDEEPRRGPPPPAPVESPAETPAAESVEPTHTLPPYREKWRELAERNQPKASGESDERPLTLSWPDLMPADYRLESVLAGYDVAGLSDTDYEAVRMLREIERELEQAPVVRELDGKRVRLPGYALPLEYADELVTEFLLVPFYGACIHVPPPPLNQMVYVIAEWGVEVRKLFDTLWVVGRLSAKRTDSEWGDAGYTLHAEGVVYIEE